MRDSRREELLKQFSTAAEARRLAEAQQVSGGVLVPEPDFVPLHKPQAVSPIVIPAPVGVDEEIQRMGVALENILDKAKEHNEQEIAVLARIGLAIAIDGSEDDVE